MNYLFRHFYQLGPVQAALLMMLFTLAAGSLTKKYSKRKIYKCFCGLFLAVWIAVILRATVLRRTEAGARVPLALPFASYRSVLHGGNPELLRSNGMNIFLFYPLGVFTGMLIPKRKREKLQLILFGIAACILSSSIEFVQYWYRIGLPECDDIIHNTLGAVLGFAAIRHSQPAVEKLEYIIRKFRGDMGP